MNVRISQIDLDRLLLCLWLAVALVSATGCGQAIVDVGYNTEATGAITCTAGAKGYEGCPLPKVLYRMEQQPNPSGYTVGSLLKSGRQRRRAAAGAACKDGNAPIKSWLLPATDELASMCRVWVSDTVFFEMATGAQSLFKPSACSEAKVLGATPTAARFISLIDIPVPNGDETSPRSLNLQTINELLAIRRGVRPSVILSDRKVRCDCNAILSEGWLTLSEEVDSHYSVDLDDDIVTIEALHLVCADHATQMLSPAFPSEHNWLPQVPGGLPVAVNIALHNVGMKDLGCADYAFRVIPQIETSYPDIMVGSQEQGSYHPTSPETMITIPSGKADGHPFVELTFSLAPSTNIGEQKVFSLLPAMNPSEENIWSVSIF